MSKGAKLIPVIYADSQETVDVLVTLGDSIRSGDWAEDEYPYPERPELGSELSDAEVEFRKELYRDKIAEVEAKREWRAGLYACHLGAKRAGLRGSELGWLEWLDLVTMPQDETDDAGARPTRRRLRGNPTGPRAWTSPCGPRLHAAGRRPVRPPRRLPAQPGRVRRHAASSCMGTRAPAPAPPPVRPHARLASRTSPGG